MSDPLQTIKSQVRALRAYTLSPHRATVKINQNENPWDLPEQIKSEAIERFSKRRWSRYPDFIPTSFLERLSHFAGWDANGIAAGNGSNELIQALLMVTVSERKRVLLSEPTFTLYRQIAKVLGGNVISIPLTTSFQYDVPLLLNTIKEVQPDVAIICSPNNPTGCSITDEDLTKILDACPGLVVVDEAYHEFARHSVVPLLADHKNLVVLRTFSKAMALAAMRVGYLLAAPELVTEIRKALLPYNLNAFSEIVAEVAMERYEEALRPLVENIITEREQLFAALSEIDGLLPVSSQANFMIVRTRVEPKQVFSELVQRDVLIRDVSSYPMLSDYFRVSVGTREENAQLLKGLREIFGNSQ